MEIVKQSNVSLLNFLKLTAICSLLSVVTTIGIHIGLFDNGDLNLDQRALLYSDNWSHFENWWIIVHCLLVLISMWGVFLLKHRSSFFLVGLGFIFYLVFSFTEIFRQLLSLFYLNGLYEQYLNSIDYQIKSQLATTIQGADLISYTLFGMFILSIALGNLFFGLSMVNGSKWDKILGWLLLFWSLYNGLTLGNEFWESTFLTIGIQNIGLFFQPFVRFFICLWLWQAIRE